MIKCHLPTLTGKHLTSSVLTINDLTIIRIELFQSLASVKTKLVLFDDAHRVLDDNSFDLIELNLHTPHDD